jgi:dipeptidyl aminopeptidase/acylaminoacyl peptidase
MVGWWDGGLVILRGEIMHRILLSTIACLVAAPLAGQRRVLPPLDTVRARQLYVSKDPKDLPGCLDRGDCGVRPKEQNDSIWKANAPGTYDIQKTTYKSSAGGLDIPVYVLSPLDKATKHPALVWVHGGVHGDWSTELFPFVVEAIQRGYGIIAPDYRGSTGYSNAFYRLIDYGGKEVDDVYSSYDFLKGLPFVDSTRVGIMGWSHGAFITAHILFRGKIPFKGGAAIVPVTNLIFRLSDHGPGYAQDYAAEEGIQGLPFETHCGPLHDHSCVEEYMKRSPVFQAGNLQVPMLVHVATNDSDAYFRENQQMVYTLIALKPNLAETKVYNEPPPGPHGFGHSFSRRVKDLKRDDSPEQIDSWDRTWAFFERVLGANGGKSR